MNPAPPVSRIRRGRWTTGTATDRFPPAREWRCRTISGGTGPAMPPQPLVSVALITYQHRPFVGQAIDSVLSQVTDFPIEIVIGEDGSTDGTLDVCLDAERRHPDRVRVLRHGHLEKIRVRGKVTGRRNWLRTVGATRGRYVAILDGDDHWIRPDKLQRQVDFLEAHPDHAFCFTDTERVAPDGTRLAPGPQTSRRRFTTRTLLPRHVVPTATSLYRREMLPDPFPDWFVHESPVADYPLAALASLRGPGRRLPGRMSLYRVGGGLWSSRGEIDVWRDTLVARRLLLQHLPPEHAPVLRRFIARDELELVRALCEAGDRDEAKTLLGTVDRGALSWLDLPILATARASLVHPGAGVLVRAWRGLRERRRRYAARIGLTR